MLSDSSTALALPNKVTDWLLGKPLASLANVKRQFDLTLQCLQLCERQIDDMTELWVQYLDIGWFRYTRGVNGSLGLETRRRDAGTLYNPCAHLEPPRSIAYSEEDRTYKSPALHWPLSTRVIDWLRFRSLALLVSPQLTQIEGWTCVDSQDDYMICHSAEGQNLRYSAVVVRGGVVLLETAMLADRTSICRELAY